MTELSRDIKREWKIKSKIYPAECREIYRLTKILREIYTEAQRQSARGRYRYPSRYKLKTYTEVLRDRYNVAREIGLALISTEEEMEAIRSENSH